MDRDLHIKMTLDNADPERKLGEFEKAADKATSKAADGTRKVDRASRDAAGGIGTMGGALGGVNRELTSLLKAQIGLSAFKNLAGNLSDQFRKTAEEIGKASREWQQFRQSLQGVASLSGKSNTNAFAAEEVDRAEKARVTPAEAKGFRESFLAKASLYVGDGPAAKMSSKDADEFQTKLMEYAKDKGISQEDMAGFAGGLLAQKQGKTNAKDMLAEAGKTFATLEASSADVKHLLPGMTRVMAQGLTSGEASRSLAGMPEIAPEEESTHFLRVLAEMRRANVEGRGEEFGMREGTSPQQQLEALVANLKKRSGGNAKELDKALREFTHEDIAANTLRGMVNKMDFQQWKDVQDKVPADQIDKTLAAERDTEPGRQRAVDSRLAVEQARLGMRNDTVERRRQIAEAEITAGGQLEHPTWLDRGKAMVPFSDDMKSQMINRQAIARARSELGESVGASDNFAAQNRGLTDELLRTLIHRIEEQTEEIKRRGGNANGVPAPMPGRPAAQRVRP